MKPFHFIKFASRVIRAQVSRRRGNRRSHGNQILAPQDSRSIRERTDHRKRNDKKIRDGLRLAKTMRSSSIATRNSFRHVCATLFFFIALRARFSDCVDGEDSRDGDNETDIRRARSEQIVVHLITVSSCQARREVKAPAAFYSFRR